MKLEELVLARCQEMLKTQGYKLFWPCQFVDLAGGEENAAQALRQLEAVGKLRRMTRVFCPDGHSIWAGPSKDLTSIPECRCCEPFQPLYDGDTWEELCGQKEHWEWP